MGPKERFPPKPPFQERRLGRGFFLLFTAFPSYPAVKKMTPQVRRAPLTTLPRNVLGEVGLSFINSISFIPGSQKDDAAGAQGRKRPSGYRIPLPGVREP